MLKPVTITKLEEVRARVSNYVVNPFNAAVLAKETCQHLCAHLLMEIAQWM